MKTMVLFFCFFSLIFARENPFEPFVKEKPESKTEVVKTYVQPKKQIPKKTPVKKIEKSPKQIGKFVRLTKESFVLVYHKTLDLRVDANLVKFVLLPEEKKISFEFDIATQEHGKSIGFETTVNYENANVSNNQNGSMVIDVFVANPVESYTVKHEKKSILIISNQ